jgi:NAD(P) transhydrogenase subunit alpha
MSGTNFIHCIVLVGALTIAATVHDTIGGVIAVAAVFLGTLNVVGGWVVTDRMLGMFRGKAAPAPAPKPEVGPAAVPTPPPPGEQR